MAVLAPAGEAENAAAAPRPAAIMSIAEAARTVIADNPARTAGFLRTLLLPVLEVDLLISDSLLLIMPPVMPTTR